MHIYRYEEDETKQEAGNVISPYSDLNICFINPLKSVMSPQLPGAGEDDAMYK